MLEEKPSAEGDRSEKPPPRAVIVSCGKLDQAGEPIEYGHGHAPVRRSPIFVDSLHVTTAVAHSSAVSH